MLDQADFHSLLRTIDSRNFCRVYPESSEGDPDGAPPGDARLTDFLRLWSWQVGAFIDFAGEGREFDEKRSGQVDLLQKLLDSLADIVEALLTSKREGRPIELPARFTESANALLTLSEKLELKGKERSIAEIARRLSAAGSHARRSSRPVRIDEQGRVFELTGDRHHGFEPEKVRESRRDIAAGRTRSLRDLQEAEARDGLEG